MPSRSPEDERRVVGFIGFGLDNQDGHQRLTQCENFFLVGGSEQTHEKMQDAAIRFTEELKRRGELLADTSIEEVLEIFHDSQE